MADCAWVCTQGPDAWDPALYPPQRLPYLPLSLPAATYKQESFFLLFHLSSFPSSIYFFKKLQLPEAMCVVQEIHHLS